MTAEYEYLTLDDLVELATLLLGTPAPIRDVGLLGSAAARPQTTAFGEDAYPDLWTKAAALLQSVLKNHAPHRRQQATGVARPPVSSWRSTGSR